MFPALTWVLPPESSNHVKGCCAQERKNSFKAFKINVASKVHSRPHVRGPVLLETCQEMLSQLRAPMTPKPLRSARPREAISARRAVCGGEPAAGPHPPPPATAWTPRHPAPGAVRLEVPQIRGDFPSVQLCVRLLSAPQRLGWRVASASAPAASLPTIRAPLPSPLQLLCFGSSGWSPHAGAAPLSVSGLNSSSAPSVYRGNNAGE